MLLQLARVLTQQQLEQTRTALQSAEWVDGRQTVGAQGALVKRNQQLDEQSLLRAELGAMVSAVLQQQPLFHAAARPLRLLPPRFNRYSDGGEYGFHADGAVMALPQGGQLRSDIACSVFINEPDSY